MSEEPSVFWSMWLTIACALAIFLPRFVPQARRYVSAKTQENAVLQSLVASRPLVILIPGTWIFRSFIKRSSWHLNGSEFTEALIEKLPIGARIIPFEWSLANTIEARNQAAYDLRALLHKEKHKKFDRIFLIGHSHGGVVALQCANLLGPSLRSKTSVCTIAMPAYRVKIADEKSSIFNILLAITFVSSTLLINLFTFRYLPLIENSISDRLFRGFVGFFGMATFIWLLYRTEILSKNPPIDAVTLQNNSLIFGTISHLDIVTIGDGVFNLFSFASKLQQFTWDRMSNCFHLIWLLGVTHTLFVYGLGGVKSCVDQGSWWYFTTDRCSTGFEVAAIWMVLIMGVLWSLSRLGNLLIGLTPAMTNFAYRIEDIDLRQVENTRTLTLELDGSPFKRHSLYIHEGIVPELATWITDQQRNAGCPY